MSSTRPILKLPMYMGSATLRLEATPEAKAFKIRGPREDAWPPTRVIDQAKERVTAAGGDPADREWLLSQVSVQFGQYQGQTFQWLLENALGYTVALLASHQVLCVLMC